MGAEDNGSEVKVEIKDGGNTDEVDFAKITLNEALSILQATPHGLTSAEHQKRLAEYGPNKLPESSRNPILVFLGYMWNPLAWAMEAAAIISIALLDYADFALIVALLIVNSVISYVEEANADAAIKALAASLAPKAKVLRDGAIKSVDAVELVPGDVILIAIGNVIPADIKILAEEDDGSEEVPMQVDQAALTGESLPAKKFTGDVCFSGSSIKQGERHCVVYATGINTFFGRAAALISATNNVANLHIVMNRIGAMCLCTIGVWIIIELCVQFAHYHHQCKGGEEACPTLTNMLVIIVGGIPIAMPTVLSVTLALGAFKLAKEGAIVARMSAVEELAGLDILCSDKTGTLTLNKLSVEQQSVMCISKMAIPEVMKHAALSANTVTEEPIDMVLASCYNDQEELKFYKTTKFVPFNPVDKITIATVLDSRTNKKFRVLKGSPQVVLGKAHNKDDIGDSVNNKMVEFANRGFRSLGIAYADGDGVGAGVETKWEMLGLIPLFDPPRHDTHDTIVNCHKQGIEVKMITGDHLLIGKETAKMLGMGTAMYTSETLIKAKNGDKSAMQGYSSIVEMVEKCNGFAEVFPEHKFEIVKILQDADHVVGMTGDGVNDAPALKKADVGIAVDGATDAARGAADIVLTQPGLSTIVTAVIGARKIFQRMTTYSKYTVSMTFRICFTFGLLTVIYDWYFPTILIVILAVFNDGAMIALAKDRVVASAMPNAWNLKHIFIMGMVYGLYLTLSSWALYQTAVKTTFFEDKCGLFSLNDQNKHLTTWCHNRFDSPEFEAQVEIPASYQAEYDANIIKYADVTSDFANTPNGAAIGALSACALGDSYLDAFSLAGLCGPEGGAPTILQQCMAEQKYVRGAMMRSLLYNQVSISGQALVFVVRTQAWSITSLAGIATYIAFLAAQTGATLIAAFGFNGYAHPRHEIEGAIFTVLSTGRKTPFFDNRAPQALTESAFTASVIGCTSYVIVAWIWSAIWHLPLDLVKWALCWVLNEDGFRDAAAFQHEKKRTLGTSSKELHAATEGPAGMVVPTYSNPLGRVSLSKPISQTLDRKSASVVAIARGSGGAGVSRISADPARALNIARKSLLAEKPVAKH